MRVAVTLPSPYREPAALAEYWSKLGERLAAANSATALGSSFPHFAPSFCAIRLRAFAVNLSR